MRVRIAASASAGVVIVSCSLVGKRKRPVNDHRAFSVCHERAPLSHSPQISLREP